MYVLTAILAGLSVTRNRWAFNSVALAVLVFYAVDKDAFFLVRDIHHDARLAFYYLLGALAYVNRDVIHLNFKTSLALFAAACLSFGTPYFDLLGGVFLAHSFLLVGYHPRLYAGDLDRFGDYSYGMYIYAFPVQQSLIYIFDGIAPWTLLPVAFCSTFLLSFLSWHLLEKKLLLIKKPVADWLSSKGRATALWLKRIRGRTA